MSEQDRDRATYHATISGGVSGQVAVGHGITQTYAVGAAGVALTEADVAELRGLLDDLKSQVAAEAPAERKDDAVRLVGELETAVTAEEPDLTTMEYVRNWFAKHLPKLAGAVASVVVHPIVGKAVEAAGDLTAAEFRRRFGGAAGAPPG